MSWHTFPAEENLPAPAKKLQNRQFLKNVARFWNNYRWTATHYVGQVESKKEEALVSRITESQLRAIVERYGRGLTLFARQWCGNPEDALQEALIDLVKLPNTPESIPAWLFQVVRNKALTQSRSERRRANHQSSAAEQKQAWFEADPSVGLDGEMVAGLLAGLPELERQIVTSRVWGELSFAEIAELVDRPVTTVFRIYRSTIVSLREQLGIADLQPDTRTDVSIELRGES